MLIGKFLLTTKRIILWGLMQILQSRILFPIRKNRILISPNRGYYYSDNSKYISEYLVTHYGTEIEIIWTAFKHPECYHDIPGIKIVKYKSPAWLYYAATASVVITQHMFSLLQPKKEGQLFINTWHGGGAYKKGVFGITGYLTDSDRHRRDVQLKNTDLFLSSSRDFTKYAIRQESGYKGEILPCGMPRNDIFFAKGKRDETARRVKMTLGLEGFVALYAPTYRGKRAFRNYTNIEFPYQDFLSILRNRFGKKSVILKRAHPGGRIPATAISGVLDVTDYPDMQELLCAADLLITDYSSSIWDFALLGRPCLLYMPDLEEYIAERGLYTPPEEWPGIICKDEKELLDTAASFDMEECRQRALRHLEMLGSYEKGTATWQVCERIMQHVNGNR